MIGRKIREYLNMNSINQVVIVDNTSITVGDLTDMLSEKRKIQIIEYMQICKALHLDMQTFIDH